MSSRAPENPDVMPPEALLTIRQTAKLLRGADRYVRELLASGELQSIAWGRAGERRIPRWCVMKWQEQLVHEPELRVRQILSAPLRPRRVTSRHQDKPSLTADQA
jgi:excisionase family DNA binding protein